MAEPANPSNVVFLANWNGADGDTAYNSEIGGAVTFENNAELDTAVKKFSSASLLGDSATNDHVTHGSQAVYQFLSDRTKSWTIEAWVYCTGLDHENYVVNTRGSGIGVALYLNSGGTVNLLWRKDSGSVIGQAISSSGAVSESTWHYIKAVYNHDSGWIRIYVDGALNGTDTTLQTAGTPINTNEVLHIGAFAGTWTGGGFDGNIGPVRIIENEALEDTDVPAAVFPGGTVTNAVIVTLPSPLDGPAIRAINDFSALITDTRSFYVMEVGGDPVLRIPVSSWQATIQSDRSNYLQAVIPAADDWADDLALRLGVVEFYVSRVTFINGQERTSELARALMDSSSYAKGANNTTVTLSGYAEASQAPASPSTKTLTGLRTITTSSTGTTRVRCDIDWFLRPGDTAVVDGTSFTVEYINYYVPTTGDIYMDVGDRQ